MTPSEVFVVVGDGDSYLATSDPASWADDLELAAHYPTAREAKAAMDAADPQSLRRMEIRKVQWPRPPLVF
ncbi:MAG: hypothetical protein F4151_14815 [Gammaproteobacteria bacterium]|nr:hypothetical protein [Gammaproteobacteria bacterium]